MTSEISTWFAAAAGIFATVPLVIEIMVPFLKRQLFSGAPAVEKLAYLALTISLVLRMGQSLSSMLIFTWCIYTAHLAVQFFYQRRDTVVLANTWLAISILFSYSYLPAPNPALIHWFSISRISFLLGYAFCLLALPFAIRHLFLLWSPPGGLTGASFQKDRQFYDRMQYRLVLVAMPLLTFGIVLEALFMLDDRRLPDPIAIWTQDWQSLLALLAWALCGIYLHTRIFFRWQNLRSTVFLLAAIAAMVTTHVIAGAGRGNL